MKQPQIEAVRLKSFFNFMGLFLTQWLHNCVQAQNNEPNSQYFITIKNTLGEKVDFANCGACFNAVYTSGIYECT